MLGSRRALAGAIIFCGVAFAISQMTSAATAQTAAPAAATPAQVQVDLFRGLADIFSRGLDTLAERLNRQGYSARVYSTGGWQTAVARISDRYFRGHKEIVVLIGHSLGGNATLQAASALDKANVPVELIVVFDATDPTPVPKNVLHIVNFYQHNGLGKPVTAGTGFQGELSNIDLTADTSIRHVTIEKSSRLHAAVVAKIQEVVDKDLAKRLEASKPKAKKAPAKKPQAGKQ